MLKHFDRWSLVVILLTFCFFLVALFVKGVPHDLLLEIGVFLVSLKLILMTHKNGALAVETRERLEAIYDLLNQQKR